MLATVAVVIAADSMPQVGQQAPGFTLPSQDGTNVSLKAFKGKWVVVYFYPKDKTPGCTIEALSPQLCGAENQGLVAVPMDDDGPSSRRVSSRVGGIVTQPGTQLGGTARFPGSLG